VRLRVPDTTVFIDLIRQPGDLPGFLDTIEKGLVFLSAVVTAELYAGTRSRAEARLVDEIIDAFASIERLLTPAGREWAVAGRLIGRRSRLYGDLRPRDHLADVLIVVSAARIKGEVVSANLEHMEQWVQLARRSGFDVTLAN
jgi:predicted nucleic acid-binding protein